MKIKRAFWNYQLEESNRVKLMHRLGIEPGSQKWEIYMLLLHQRRSIEINFKTSNISDNSGLKSKDML